MIFQTSIFFLNGRGFNRFELSAVNLDSKVPQMFPFLSSEHMSFQPCPAGGRGAMAAAVRECRGRGCGVFLWSRSTRGRGCGDDQPVFGPSRLAARECRDGEVWQRCKRRGAHRSCQPWSNKPSRLNSRRPPSAAGPVPCNRSTRELSAACSTSTTTTSRSTSAGNSELSATLAAASRRSRSRRIWATRRFFSQWLQRQNQWGSSRDPAWNTWSQGWRDLWYRWS